MASQEHYSFLENLEKDQLDLYDFGRVWRTNYDRLAINFIAVMGDDILDSLPMEDIDEPYLTVTVPRRLGKCEFIPFHSNAERSFSRICLVSIWSFNSASMMLT